jgi:type IV secretion system protein VirB9
MKVLLALLLACCAATGPALAAEEPAASRDDGRMRIVPYQPDNVVDLVASVGSSLALQFDDKETVADIWVSDSSKTDIRMTAAGNVAIVKPAVALPAEPMFVRTQRADGGIRLYTFQLEVKPADDPGPNTDTMYRVRFTYPEDVEAAHAAAARVAAAARATRIAARHLADPSQAGPSNYRYVAQGDRNLVPVEMWDDGLSTYIRYAGNQRIPSVYVIDPDGEEALTNYSVEGSLITIHQTALRFRLRDGDTVLCIWNRGWNPAGSNPGTGTTKPDVMRELRDGRS